MSHKWLAGGKMDAGFNPAARRLVLPGGGGGDSRGGGKCRGACGKGDGEGGRGADLNALGTGHCQRAPRRQRLKISTLGAISSLAGILRRTPQDVKGEGPADNP